MRSTLTTGQDQFYGTIEHIDPELKMFLHDQNRPSAILLEYIPNMEMLHEMPNYAKKAWRILLPALEKFTKL